MATLPENLSQLSQMIPKPEKDIGCQALVETAGVSKHGFLRKMPVSWGGRLFDSMLSRKWSSKFVILRSGCVYIYSSETASNYDRAYSLFGFQEVTQCGVDFYKAGRWTFLVSDALQDSNRDRSMYFSASSENNMKKWIDAFQKEICQGNCSVLNAASSHNRFQQRPLADFHIERRLTMPPISEELREKMRRSIAFEKNVNICHEEKESSSGSDEYSDLDENELNAARMQKKRPLPIPPAPFGTEHVTKAETAAIGAASRPLPKPIVAEKPKPPPTSVKPANYGTASVPPPAPLKPATQIPVFTVPLAPVKQDSPSTLPRFGLAKPTNAVKPFPPQPSTSSGPSNLRDRMVPQPPSFLKDLHEAINNRSFEDSEGRAVYAEGDDYEYWVSGEECMTDALVRASYWKQESEKALEIMQTINRSGVFLIRDAADGLEFKTLMVCTSEVKSSVIKYRITKDSSQTYSLHPDQPGFQTLKELIRYYQQNLLPNRTLKLTQPYLEVWKPN